LPLPENKNTFLRPVNLEKTSEYSATIAYLYAIAFKIIFNHIVHFFSFNESTITTRVRVFKNECHLWAIKIIKIAIDLSHN
jgi:hypothetical protein